MQPLNKKITQPLNNNKKLLLMSVLEKLCNLSTHKITQPLHTQKNHAPSQQQKTRNLCEWVSEWEKSPNLFIQKITQPLHTK